MTAGAGAGRSVVVEGAIEEALVDGSGSGDARWARALGRVGHGVMRAVALDTGVASMDALFGG